MAQCLFPRREAELWFQPLSPASQQNVFFLLQGAVVIRVWLHFHSSSWSCRIVIAYIPQLVCGLPSPLAFLSAPLNARLPLSLRPVLELRAAWSRGCWPPKAHVVIWGWRVGKTFTHCTFRFVCIRKYISEARLTDALQDKANMNSESRRRSERWYAGDTFRKHRPMGREHHLWG